MIAKITIALCLGFLIGSAAHADDWPMFGRDQSRNAVSPEKNAPAFWQIEDSESGKPSKNILWTAPIGSGASYYGSLGDPVIVDGRIWIGTNAKSGNELNYAFLCLDEKTGKPLYRYLAPYLPAFGYERFLHTMGSSPLCDGDRMWFFNNRWEVVCLDTSPLRKRQGDPRELWKVDTKKELGVFRRKSIWDCRLCSVAAHGDRLYVITGNGPNNWDCNGSA